MGNSENVVSLDDKKKKKEGFRKKALDTAKDITDKSTEALKESVKPVTELGKDLSKTIRYGMKKRTETVIHMYGTAEDKAEREDIRKGELKKSYCQYGLMGLGFGCGTAIAITWIKSNSKLS
ncbi:hypothetical protein [Bacillus altitudinis]|uniref:hypothetical protein n=1 Tax=Bacillus altitudinis TaxID=293387 RepID=UPI000D6B0564|nr:hypothetical protein [Bacillus altitudinis]PWN86011.1 hypothetical protein CTM99_02205 [Bacillus altitudinis]